MKLTTLIAASAILLGLITGCTNQTEPSPDPVETVILKPGESHQIKISDATYKIVYDSTKVEFTEGVVEGSTGTANYYVLGKVKLVINNESVSLTGIGSYDDKGMRRSSTWAYLKEQEFTKTVGSITVGAANLYPASSDPSINANYTVELLIQRQ